MRRRCGTSCYRKDGLHGPCAQRKVTSQRSAEKDSELTSMELSRPPTLCRVPCRVLAACHRWRRTLVSSRPLPTGRSWICCRRKTSLRTRSNLPTIPLMCLKTFLTKNIPQMRFWPFAEGTTTTQTLTRARPTAGAFSAEGMTTLTPTQSATTGRYSSYEARSAAKTCQH